MSDTQFKISNAIEDQLPSFIYNEDQLLSVLLKAYYKWSEQPGRPLHEARSLLDNQDLDAVDDVLWEHFKEELYARIPISFLVNKRLLAKNIKDLYQTKGTSASYRILFRALFDEEIEFYNPGNDILRASDGRWVEESSVRVSQITGSSTLFEGRFIFGSTTNARGIVKRISNTTEFGVKVSELFLERVVGIFEDGELVTTDDGLITGVVYGTTGPLLDIVLRSGGTGHTVGDLVEITAEFGSAASGFIIETSDTTSVSVQINDGGSGYFALNANTQTDITSGSGSGADFVISQVSNTEPITLNRDVIGSVHNVVLDTGPTFSSLGSNTTNLSANLASANVYSVLSTGLLLSNVQMGTITSITMTSYGTGYDTSLPTVSAIQSDVSELNIPDGTGGYKGRNANLSAIYASGAIKRISISAAGEAYSKFDTLLLFNSNASVNAIATPVVGGFRTYEGKYIDTRGWLSWNNKLQDNYYYQEFSYVIKTKQPLDKYKSTVLDTVHPTGLQMFGEVQVQSTIDAAPISVANISSIVVSEITQANTI